MPLLLAQRLAQLSGWTLAAIALATVMGHVFSIFLGFRGRKAVAVSFGIWAGLSGWPTLFVLGALLLEGYAKNSLTGFGNGAGLIAGTVFHWLVFLSPWVLFGLGLARTGVPRPSLVGARADRNRSLSAGTLQPGAVVSGWAMPFCFPFQSC